MQLVSTVSAFHVKFGSLSGDCFAGSNCFLPTDIRQLSMTSVRVKYCDICCDIYVYVSVPSKIFSNTAVPYMQCSFVKMGGVKSSASAHKWNVLELTCAFLDHIKVSPSVRYSALPTTLLFYTLLQICSNFNETYSCIIKILPINVNSYERSGY